MLQLAAQLAAGLSVGALDGVSRAPDSDAAHPLTVEAFAARSSQWMRRQRGGQRQILASSSSRKWALRPLASKGRGTRQKISFENLEKSPHNVIELEK